jgi:hypothetical protein
MSVLDLQSMTSRQDADEEQLLQASDEQGEQRGSGLSILVY